MPRRDFNFATNLLKAFFGSSRIKNTLNFLDDHEMSGWEKWFQIEFSLFLDSRVEISEWDIEVPFPIDKRKDIRKDHARVDFILRKKNASKNKFIILEVKIKEKASTCIRGMIKDLKKIEKIKTPDIELRSYWLAGIHCFEEPQKIISSVIAKANEIGIRLQNSEIYAERIGNTQYSLTIF